MAENKNKFWITVLLVLFVGTPFFLLVIPYGIYLTGNLIDKTYSLPKVLDTWGWDIFAILLILIGLFFTIWSLFYMTFRFKISPMGSAPKGQLITSGPYAISRNPMWLGNLLIYTGLGIYLNSLGAIILVLVLWIIFSLYLKFVEEKKLLKTFGKDYQIYMQNVPMLFPRPRCPFKK